MNLINFFKMHNWKIKEFLITVFVIQISLLSIILLESIGIKIPFLREIIGVIYLCYIPGILILRILKMYKLETVEVILYSVGLSIASIMFIGLLMNTFYPLLSIQNPISLNWLLITMILYVSILSFISYKMDNGFYLKEFISSKDITSSWTLFFILLPFMSIIGAFLVNYYDSNVLLMLLILIVSLVPIIIAFDKIPSKLYPLAIFSISITLLFHTSLITNYIWGWDIHQEYHYAELVLDNAFWNNQFENSSNGVLSIVMLAPVFSVILNVGLAWIFKVIYPFLFSFLPLGLYVLFQRQTKDKRIAFLACFFFMAIYSFYGEMLSLARQEIAMVFLILMILSLFYRDNKPILFVIFGMGLIVSHYSLSYIYMAILLGVWVILTIINNKKIRDLKHITYLKTGISKNISFNSNMITLNFALLFLVFTLGWYIYSSSNTTFESLVSVFNHIVNSTSSDFLNPNSSQGLQIVAAAENGYMREIAKYMHLITQFFIIIGFLGLLFGKYKNKFDIKYIAFSLFNLLICFGAIVLPNFAAALNTSRLYYISLIFLAPFSILGGITFFSFFINRVKKWRIKSFDKSLKILSIFFVIFFLFNCGFLIEFTHDNPSSLALSKNNFADLLELDSDVASAQWLSTFNTSTQKYCLYDGADSLISYGNSSDDVLKLRINSWLNMYSINSDSYIFIKSGEKNEIPPFTNKTVSLSQEFLKSINEIYDSNSEVYSK